MAIQNRTVTITGVFAADASTTIPPTPVSGASYRDESMTGTVIREGWAFKTIVDSSKFNQAMYEYSSLTSQIEKYGFLPWSSLTDYEQNSLCLGTDGVIYQAKQATGPSTTVQDPTTDSSHTYWQDFVGSTYVTLATAQTISGNKTHTGTTTFNAAATFSSSVSLGGSATATTPSSATDNSTKVATTAWVTNHLNNATVKKNLVTLVAPKWSSKTSISSGYTASGNGWVVWKDNKYNSNDHYISINGNEIARTGGQRGDWAESSQCQILVSSGDKVTYSGGTCWFVPCKGG